MFDPAAIDRLVLSWWRWPKILDRQIIGSGLVVLARSRYLRTLRRYVGEMLDR
jgi:hypothetical protein